MDVAREVAWCLQRGAAQSLARRRLDGTTRREVASQEVEGNGVCEMVRASGWDAWKQ
jgi:hypothetical protein